MLIFGDVFAVVALAAGGFATAWGLLLAIRFLMPKRAEAASHSIQSSPFGSIFGGLLVTLVVGFFALVASQAPMPLLKLIGFALYLCLIGFGLVGICGLVVLLGARIAEHDPKLSPFGAASRAAMLLVASALVPFIGWFLIAPLLLVLGVGSGLRALRTPSQASDAGLAPPVL